MNNPIDPMTSPAETPGRRRPRAPWRIVRSLVTRLLVQLAIDCLRDLW